MSIYQHYREEERPFIDQILSWMEQVERQYQPRVTDFLDPREQLIFRQLLSGQTELQWSLSGGTEKAERKRGIIAPLYDSITPGEFSIELLEATYPDKFVTLEHRDVMGSFLSLGIDRKKLGDISVGEGVIQLFTTSDITTYIRANLVEVKRAKVTWESVDLNRFRPEEVEWVTSETTVSSLRLDAIIKELYRMSRQQAAEHIQKGLVKVNFKTVEDVSFQLAEGDLLSLRGMGRGKLAEVKGTTKKDKQRITLEKLK
ncbi:YlmH family RNA-binding protein [Terribacillus saccharophilus]|uniref:YlmH family RNA-binding protein n=1 Tax=Terribacillus saccharophilus TaxID=361277 RepID=UPI000C9AD8BC|nr:YlmH/Sll1252 family protein [Terribacillus goriensis]MEC0283075.1 YlmH/Sll1252 family protein [Terribacillus saccharophilus]MEC0290032.1 YlmH/Sll1252 family protein [Terribacillus saccharophilus]